MDNSLFIEAKNGKRIIHHRSLKFPARTILTDLPDFQLVETFSLADYLTALSTTGDSVTEFIL